MESLSIYLSHCTKFSSKISTVMLAYSMLDSMRGHLKPKLFSALLQHATKQNGWGITDISGTVRIVALLV